MRVGWTKERGAVGVGQQRGEQAESWRGTMDRASQHWTLETVWGPVKKIESKDVGIPVLVEFSLVTHASDSPHMHVVLQYLLFALG